MEIGVDIIEIARIKSTIERWGERFLGRIFTAVERETCTGRIDPYSGYAARFAAKEAVIKALGRRVNFQDIEVVNDRYGKPYVKLKSRAQEFLEARKLAISLSHSRTFAVAVCVMED